MNQMLVVGEQGAVIWVPGGATITIGSPRQLHQRVEQEPISKSAGVEIITVWVCRDLPSGRSTSSINASGLPGSKYSSMRHSGRPISICNPAL